MNIDNKDTVEPIQLVKGDNGKPVVPVVTAKTAAVMPDGRACWVYADGSVRGERGRLMSLPPYALVPITSDNSIDMTHRRDALGVERALRGMQMAADDLGITVDQPADLWSHIVRSQAVEAIRKRATDAARLVGQAARQLPERGVTDAEQPATGHAVDVDALIRLGQMFDREAQRRAELIAADMLAVDGVVVQLNDE